MSRYARNFLPSRIEDGIIAEIEFGWTWQQRRLTLDPNDPRFVKMLIPPDGDVYGFEPINYCPDFFSPAALSTEPDLDWCCCIQKDPKRDWNSIRDEIPFFTTSADDDYLLLTQIRYKYTNSWSYEFSELLMDLWNTRCKKKIPAIIHY